MKYFINEGLSEISESDFISETTQIIKLDKGYIYIVLDKAFPKHFKIGRTTDLSKRLSAYNADKPYPSTYVYVVSREFEEVSIVEKSIIKKLYQETPSTTFSKEWFLIDYLELAIDLIEEAEILFN